MTKTDNDEMSFALVKDMRLPTGNETNFLGSGTVGREAGRGVSSGYTGA